VYLDSGSDNLAAELIDLHSLFLLFLPGGLGFISFRPLTEKKYEKYPLRSLRLCGEPV
jgi:hypothetical protein